MNTRTALKWSVIYHVVALGAALLGLAIAGAGLYVGLSGSFASVNPLQPGTFVEAFASARLLPAAGGIVLGAFVWRVGRTTARLKANAETVDSAVDVPSTSVLSRKVGREVSESAVEAIRDADADTSGAADTGGSFGGGQSEFDGADTDAGVDAGASESGDPLGGGTGSEFGGDDSDDADEFGGGDAGAFDDSADGFGESNEGPVEATPDADDGFGGFESDELAESDDDAEGGDGADDTW